MQSSLTPSGLSPHVASLVSAFITNAERKFMASGRTASVALITTRKQHDHRKTI